MIKERIQCIVFRIYPENMSLYIIQYALLLYAFLHVLLCIYYDQIRINLADLQIRITPSGVA
jgi:hypothetical protein